MLLCVSLHWVIACMQANNHGPIHMTALALHQQGLCMYHLQTHPSYSWCHLPCFLQCMHGMQCTWHTAETHKCHAPETDHCSYESCVHVWPWWRFTCDACYEQIVQPCMFSTMHVQCRCHGPSQCKWCIWAWSQPVWLCVQAGWSGKYNTNEKYFYCLDALPIFSAFCVYSLLHFGQYLQNTDETSTGAAKTSAVIVVTDSSSSMSRPRENSSSKMDQVKSALTFGLAQKTNSNTAHPRFSELVWAHVMVVSGNCTSTLM